MVHFAILVSVATIGLLPPLIRLIMTQLVIQVIALVLTLILLIQLVVLALVGTVSPSVVWRTRLDKFNGELRFVRSGNINLDNGSTRYLGIDGYYWSSTASPVFNSGSAGLTDYNLYFGASNVSPADGPYARWLGFPIRCLAY